ncbi:MAG: hypothetical protein GHCLOJNM_03995 [bacterium]|nr:hypothetical protein [bacterium]
MATFHQPLPAPPPRTPRGHSPLAVVFVIVLLVFIALMVALFSLVFADHEDGLRVFRHRVAVVEIFGTIFEASDWVELLEDCAEDNGISAVVLHIDSPGGAISPTQEIYEAARKIAGEGKPVIAYMASVAASGGYYAACGADEIMGMSGTLTGSIGVYMQMMNLSDLLGKLGVEFDTVKKGAFKTAGDFSREMKGHERAMFQSVIDDYYRQFLDAVADSRTRNKVSLARGWNKELPGGVVEGETEVAGLGGVIYPSPAWSSLGLSAPNILAATGSPEGATAEGVVAPSQTATATPTASIPAAPASEVNEKLTKMFADGLTRDAIRKRVEALAEGRIYTGRQALEVGLIDSLGTLQDAIDRAGELAGLGEDPPTTTRKKKEPRGLFGVRLSADFLKTGSRFLYLCPYGI